MEPPGGVDDDERMPFALRMFKRAFAMSSGFAVPVGKYRNRQRLAERFELVDRRRPIGIARHQKRPMSLFPVKQRQFRAGGGLSRSLQTRKHDDIGPVRMEPQSAAPPRP